jgi:hypothetical protein
MGNVSDDPGMTIPYVPWAEEKKEQDRKPEGNHPEKKEQDICIFPKVQRT